MSETDTYLISRMRDELIAQNKKIDKISEQLEAQTRLQEGIFKQLYLLCQIEATPSTNQITRDDYASTSADIFMGTPMSKLEHDDKMRGLQCQS